MSGGEILPLVYSALISTAVSTGVNSVLGATSAKPGKQDATPAAPKQADATTDTQRNSSEVQADILRKEQARKGGGIMGNESILTGGLGSLGKAETAGGAKTLLGA